MKGRPPLEPRIKELEKQVDALLRIMEGMDDRLRELEGRQTRTYEPLFDRWPGGVNGR